MKKILGILVLSLLFSNEEIAAKNIKFSKDLGIGVKARVSSVSHKKNIVFKKLRLKTGILLDMEK